MLFNRIGAAMAAASLVLGACSDRALTEPELSTPAFSYNPNTAYPPPANVCGTPYVADLRVGTKVVGTVTIVNEASKLFVTYKTNAPYYISDTRLEVARNLSDIPRYWKGGQANPWAFDYAHEHEPVDQEWYYTVNYSDWNLKAGDEVLLAVMAGVLDASRYWQWSEAWINGARIHPSYPKEQYVKYKLQGCTPTPPPPTPVTGGVVTITFDDGWETTYTNAFPVLQEFGLRGNVAINSQPIDEMWTGYMNIAQVQQLNAAGWSMVNHTVTHRDLTTLTEAEVHAEVRDNRAWIERNGFRGGNVFVVPFHSWGERERNVIMQYATHARGYSVNQFPPTPRYESYPPADRYGLTGFEPEFAPYTTPEGREQTRQIVDYAVKNNKFVDIFFHQIPTENVPAFREMMRILAEYKINIRTYHEAFPTTVVVNN